MVQSCGRSFPALEVRPVGRPHGNLLLREVQQHRLLGRKPHLGRIGQQDLDPDVRLFQLQTDRPHRRGPRLQHAFRLCNGLERQLGRRTSHPEHPPPRLSGATDRIVQDLQGTGRRRRPRDRMGRFRPRAFDVPRRRRHQRDDRRHSDLTRNGTICAALYECGRPRAGFRQAQRRFAGRRRRERRSDVGHHRGVDRRVLLPLAPQHEGETRHGRSRLPFARNPAGVEPDGTDPPPLGRHVQHRAASADESHMGRLVPSDAEVGVRGRSAMGRLERLRGPQRLVQRTRTEDRGYLFGEEL